MGDGRADDRDPPSAPWTYTDIGDYLLDERRLGTYGVVSVRRPGITSYDAPTGRFTIRGAGSDLDVIGQGMTMQYVYLPVDRTITARVVWQDDASTGTRAGLLMAESLPPFDQMAGAASAGGGTDDSGARFVRQVRVATRLVTTTDRIGSLLPLWLRLRRTGESFTAETSDDGRPGRRSAARSRSRASRRTVLRGPGSGVGRSVRLAHNASDNVSIA